MLVSTRQVIYNLLSVLYNVLMETNEQPDKKKVDYSAGGATDLLDNIIISAIEKNASDIHVEPKEDFLRILMRVDGVLHEVEKLPIKTSEKIISRLKVMANLNIVEQRKPQDGHILFKSRRAGMEDTDLRLSIFPSVRGEVAVMRVLNRDDLLFDSLEALGMEKDHAEKIRMIIKQSSGMVLATGPGGSGKSTTLYTILNSMKGSGKNIMTLEDPVELNLKHVRQAQIQPEIGFDFADGLRSILRQDANVVMVGEIRDDQTAQIALRASLMGVLFFSTMHTTSSIGAIARFVELGIPRSFISSAMRAVIAKRLMRMICRDCKAADVNPSKKLMEEFGVTPEQAASLQKGQGCKACSGSGYKGRVGVFEVLIVDEAIQDMILESATYREIEHAAIENGMKTLKQAALEKALAGDTTLEEVLRVAS